MIWLLLLAVAGGLVWFLVQPRREVRPIAQAAADRAGDIPAPDGGHGDSLTKDRPHDQSESQTK